MDQDTKNIIMGLKLVAFDFDGVFTDNRVIVSEEGTESVMCCRSDGLGLSRLKELGISVVILSTEPNKVVAARAGKLKIKSVHGCEDKLSVLKETADSMGISLKETAFVGNDINDAECLSHAGLSVVVSDAYEEVRPLAKIALERKGGYGAVREICDIIYNVIKGD